MRRKAGQLVAGLLFAAIAAVCPNLHAQDSSDPHWLLQYRTEKLGGDVAENQLLSDKRFGPFVDHYLRMKQTFWDKGESMGDVALEFLGVPGTVDTDGVHYYSAEGCVPHACFDKGMLWVGLKPAPPSVFFAATRLREEKNATGYKLLLFANKPVNAADLPIELRKSIARWTATPLGDGNEIETITQAVIVGPDGQEKIVEPKTLGVAEAAQEKSDKQ